MKITNPINRLAQSVLDIYQTDKDTPVSIEHIESLARQALPDLLDNRQLQQQRQAILDKTRQTRFPQKLSVRETGTFCMTLHTLPQQMVMPKHHHPQAINLILMVEGEAAVERYSSSNGHQVQQRTLRPGEVDAGLPGYLNPHRIEAHSPVAAFLSLHCKVQTQHPKNVRRLLLIPALCCSLLFPLSPAVSCNDSSGETSLETSLETAHQLRIHAASEQQLQQAFQLYSKAAEQGNAEAQYWLAYMYIMGMGTTRNEKQAIHWAFLAEQQGYPPAIQLLDDLIQGRFDERIPQC